MIINPYMVGPDYSSLSNVEARWKYSGLAVNETNDYGSVNGSAVLTSWKSLAAQSGRDLSVVGTTLTLTSEGIAFGGSGNFHNSTVANWNFLHYNATLANFKWTSHAVVKFGTSSNPNAIYGLFGTNAGSNSNKGGCAFYDDRSASSRNNGAGSIISAGGGTNILNAFQNDVLPANEFFVWTIETRFDITINAFRQSHYVNGILFGVAITSASTTLVTTPTFGLDVGAIGNSGSRFTGVMKELVLQSTVESNGYTRDAFIRGLIVEYRINVTASLGTVDATRTFQVADTVNTSGKYYLDSVLAQHPTKKYLLLNAFRIDDDHTPTGVSVWAIRKSINYGITWSSVTTIIPAVANLNAVGGGGGFDPYGRFHLFVDLRTINGSPSYIHHLYSDDDGDSFTTEDMTSYIPNDGLNAYAIYGEMRYNQGYLMMPFYKATDWGNVTQTAVYIFRKHIDSPTWSVSTVRAPAASPVLVEMAIEALSNTSVVAMARNDTTGEFSMISSSDNGATFVSPEDASFGEALAVPGPGKFTRFYIDSNGTPVLVVGWWWTNRVATPLTKVCFGLASDVRSSGYSGFNQSTKTTLVNSGRRAHYFSICHQMDNFNALMGSAYEQASIDLSDNDYIVASMLSTNYSTVKTALGL